jgi:hypothetical protein
MDALTLIRQDHQEVQELFKRFENSSDQREKQRIAEQALMELDVHATVEEEIFYPSMRRMNQGESETSEMMNEAEEEHHVAEMLIDELRAMRQVDDRFEAKFKVLAEAVKHHIQEEESEMLPKAAEVGRDRLETIGEEMAERKMELMEIMESGRLIRQPAKRAGSRSTAKRATASRSGNGRRASAGTTRKRGASGTARKSTAKRGTAKRSTTSRGSSNGRTATKKSASRSSSGSGRGGARSANGRPSRTTRTTRATTTRSRSTNGRKTANRGGAARKRTPASRSQ